MTKKITDDQLKKALDEVEQALTSQLLLNKSEDSLPPKKEDKEESPAAPEASAPKADDAPPAPAADDAAPAPEASAPDADPAVEPELPVTLESLKADYAQLDPDSLAMHFEACKAAMMATSGAMGGAPAPGAPPALGAPDASAPAAAPPMAPPAAPAPDMSAPPASPPAPAPEKSPLPFMKSEAEDTRFASLQKKLDDQSHQIETMAKFVSSIVSAPVRKAVTGLNYIERADGASEKPTVTRAEAKTALGLKARDPSLKKSDRDLINKFCTDSSVKIDDISHLLK